MMVWTGIGWAGTGSAGGASAQLPRAWSVSVVVAGGHDVAASSGVVVAVDLELAAEQMCAHLDDALCASGRCYLLATRDRIRGSAGERPNPMKLLAAIRRDPVTGAATHGDWFTVDDPATAVRSIR